METRKRDPLRTSSFPDCCDCCEGRREHYSIPTRLSLDVDTFLAALLTTIIIITDCTCIASHRITSRHNTRLRLSHQHLASQHTLTHSLFSITYLNEHQAPAKSISRQPFPTSLHVPLLKKSIPRSSRSPSFARRFAVHAYQPRATSPSASPCAALLAPLRTFQRPFTNLSSVWLLSHSLQDDARREVRHTWTHRKCSAARLRLGGDSVFELCADQSVRCRYIGLGLAMTSSLAIGMGALLLLYFCSEAL